jgi:AmiR/NasT family two-component response regulator
MRRHAETVGVIGVLTAGQPLAAADARLARTLAEAATIAILQQRALRGSLAKSEQLQHALDTRVVIEQAKGAVAARLGIRPDAAFELLRAYARRHNRTLTAVARAAIDGELSGVDELAGDDGATRRGRPGHSR